MVSYSCVLQAWIAQTWFFQVSHEAMGTGGGAMLAHVSVIRILIVLASYVLFTLTNHALSMRQLSCSCQCCQMITQRLYHVLYHDWVILHIVDLQLFLMRGGHCVLVAAFCLSVYSMHVLNRDAEYHQLARASAADRFNKGYAMCYHIYVIMHVK